MIILIPFSGGSLNKNKGTEYAPGLISKKLKLKTRTIKVNNNNADETYNNIENADGKMFIGGDHSITYFLFKSFSKKYINPGLIILDAHPDSEVYTSTPSHEDFVRKLIDDRLLRKENLIQIGLRKISKNEEQYLKQIKWFKPKDSLKNIQKALVKLNIQCSALYLSIDTDVIDKKYFKSTGYPEPNGLTPRKFFKILNQILKLNIQRADLVEYNPLLDKNKKDQKLIIEVVKKLISNETPNCSRVAGYLTNTHRV